MYVLHEDVEWDFLVTDIDGKIDYSQPVEVLWYIFSFSPISLIT